jgi:hypothetical protein
MGWSSWWARLRSSVSWSDESRGDRWCSVLWPAAAALRVAAARGQGSAAGGAA